MELFLDPTVWLGLLTLIVLEIVLGIDNLVFIAILADKLPPQQRDRARLIGLSLALLMRLGLLASIAWLVTLTEPLFEVLGKSFSGRDLIMLFGGVFAYGAVRTAVGMVVHLPVMMAAVIISMGLMMVASKPLTAFVNARPTVIMLCLGFLMMIGFSLTAEGLGFHIPKGYLYAA